MKGNTVPVQNIGLFDRLFRFFGGGALLAVGVITITVAETPSVWSSIAILFSIYPLMTTIMGWDPLYQMIGGRTCNLESGRNQCGTFPYEVDAALGHNPEPDEGYRYDHSLGGSHHKEEKQKGKVATA